LSSDGKCFCGLPSNSHPLTVSTIDLKDSNVIEWSVENNTRDNGLTDAYGEVKFKNFSEYSEVTAKVNYSKRIYTLAKNVIEASYRIVFTAFLTLLSDTRIQNN